MLPKVQPFQRASPESTPCTSVFHPSGARWVNHAGVSTPSKLSCHSTRDSAPSPGCTSSPAEDPSDEPWEDPQEEPNDDPKEEPKEEPGSEDWAAATGAPTIPVSARIDEKAQSLFFIIQFLSVLGNDAVTYT